MRRILSRSDDAILHPSAEAPNGLAGGGGGRDAARRALLKIRRRVLELGEANQAPGGQPSRWADFGVFFLGENDAAAVHQQSQFSGAAK
jgi:hypothetical protein